MTMNGWLLQRKYSNTTYHAITREQAKAQCEVDADITAHDTWFHEAIHEAQRHIEERIKSTIMESVWLYTGPTWPCFEPYQRLRLPMGPVIEVLAVSYLDRNGDRQYLQPDSDYSVIQSDREAWIYPAWGQSWPYARDTPGSIAVEYSAGYRGLGSPPDASAVPVGIQRAMKMLVAHWFENREAVLTGTISKEIEEGLAAVLQPYRNYP